MSASPVSSPPRPVQSDLCPCQGLLVTGPGRQWHLPCSAEGSSVLSHILSSPVQFTSHWALPPALGEYPSPDAPNAFPARTLRAGVLSVLPVPAWHLAEGKVMEWILESYSDPVLASELSPFQHSRWPLQPVGMPVRPVGRLWAKVIPRPHRMQGLLLLPGTQSSSSPGQGRAGSKLTSLLTTTWMPVGPCR